MSRVLIIGSYDIVSREIAEALGSLGVPTESAVGHADTLQKLRLRSFGVVISSSESSIDEDLALLDEMRLIRPAVKFIVLAPHSTPDDVIAAMPSARLLLLRRALRAAVHRRACSQCSGRQRAI